MRIRALRQPPGAILQEAAERMGIVSFERRAQRQGRSAPAGRFAERAVAARIGKEGEGLVVEMEGRIADLAVQINDRARRNC